MTENLLVKLPALPRQGCDAFEVQEWIDAAIVQLDDTPSRKYWRWHAMEGKSQADVFAESAPRHYRLDMWVPVGEQRLVNDAAKARGLAVRAYARAALGTVLCATDGYSPDAFPELLKHGFILPRR